VFLSSSLPPESHNCWFLPATYPVLPWPGISFRDDTAFSGCYAVRFVVPLPFRLVPFILFFVPFHRICCNRNSSRILRAWWRVAPFGRFVLQGSDGLLFKVGAPPTSFVLFVDVDYTGLFKDVPLR